MTRVIIFFAILALVYVVAALWWRSFKKRLRNMFQPSVRNENRIIDRGMMIKDPIDGTYVAATDAFVYKKKGKTYYFSSRENLKEFIRMKNWKENDGD